MKYRAKFAALMTATLLSSAPTLAQSQDFDVMEASISDIHEAYRAGEVSVTKLVETYLQRIEEIDGGSISLNSLITVSPSALEVAAQLDESEAGGPLYGIPIILKDNYDTKDMPTTGGSLSLKDSTPPADATIVEKMRDAGAIILAKGNLDEWAHGGSPGGGYSSAGGQTLNPYNLNRGPAGSSGGPAAAVAANLGVVGMGSDTLGSIRGPVTNNALVGIKPTLGLVSRAGIIPFSLTFDVAGPMTRSVEDAAVVLGVIAGVDPKDPATYKSVGKAYQDYTQFLEVDGLQGARIGVLRNYFGANPSVDASVNAAIDELSQQGAVIVDPLMIPEELIAVSGAIYGTVSDLEFKWQLADYLGTLEGDAPKTLEGIIADAEANDLPLNSRVLERLHLAENRNGLDDPYYLATREHGPEMFRSVIDSILEENNLDALVYPTSGCTSRPLASAQDDTYECGEAPGAPTLLAYRATRPFRSLRALLQTVCRPAFRFWARPSASLAC